jgi:hypothetical protein
MENPNLRFSTTHEHETGSSAPDQEPYSIPIDTDTHPNVKKPRFPMGAKIAAGLAGIGIVGAAVGIGINTSNGESNAPHKAPVENSAPAEPSEAASPSKETQPSSPTENETVSNPEAPLLTGEALTEAFTIPETASGEQLGQAFVQKLQDWGQYGEVNETQEHFLYEDDHEVYITNQSQEAAQYIAPALIAEGHENNQTTTIVDKLTQDNIAITTAWAATYSKTPGDNPFPTENKEAFNQTLEFDGAETVSEGEGATTLDISFTQHTNLNNLMDPTHPSTINPNDEGFAKDNVKTTWRVTFVQQDGANKVANLYVR